MKKRPGTDSREIAQAATRNIGPILEVLASHAPQQGRALEIASGTGQHMARLAAAFPGLDFQPTDIDAGRMASINAWRSHTGLANFGAPMIMDASQPWPPQQTGLALICLVNVLHLIASPPARAILENAANALAPGGVFTVYGPFLRGEVFASDGDRAFHESLCARDPAIGYKDIAWAERILETAGLALVDRVDMPASNLMIVARWPG